MLNNSASLKRTVFAHSKTTNKLVNETANNSTWVSGEDYKIPPALGTNHIAGFGGFHPLASLEKNKLFLHNYFQNLTKNVILPGKMSILCDI